MEIQVQLFGAAQARFDTASIAFLPDKRFLLLAYRADWVS